MEKEIDFEKVLNNVIEYLEEEGAEQETIYIEDVLYQISAEMINPNNMKLAEKESKKD